MVFESRKSRVEIDQVRMCMKEHGCKFVTLEQGTVVLKEDRKNKG